MEIITLFEHQRRSFKDLGIQSDELILSGIEEVNRRTNTEIFQLLYREIRATQYVGVVQVGDTIIQVLPKIDYANYGDSESSLSSEPFKRAVDSAAANLLNLLSYTHDLSIKQTNVSNISDQKCAWIELLTRLLAVELHSLMQRGLEHCYVQVEEDLPVMRGRWQIEQQLSRRPYVRHHFDVRYDDFSADTALNRIFRYVVESLLLISQDALNRSLLLDLKNWLVNVYRYPIILTSQLDEIHFTRLNERFKPAFNLARLFIENSSIKLSSGRVHTFTFMLDMNDLFEQFVFGFLQKHREMIFPEGWRNIQLRKQSERTRYHLAKREMTDKKVFRLRPDILFMDPQGKPLLILDTKYKQIDQSFINSGVSESDIYQMLAYEVGLNCPNTLVIYPEQNRLIRERYSFTKSVGQVKVATINLKQNLQEPQQMIADLRDTFLPYSRGT